MCTLRQLEKVNNPSSILSYELWRYQIILTCHTLLRDLFYSSSNYRQDRLKNLEVGRRHEVYYYCCVEYTGRFFVMVGDRITTNRRRNHPEISITVRLKQNLWCDSKIWYDKGDYLTWDMAYKRILKPWYVGDYQPSMHLHNKLTTNNYPCGLRTVLCINNFKHTTDASTIDTNFAAIMDSFLDTKNKDTTRVWFNYLKFK